MHKLTMVLTGLCFTAIGLTYWVSKIGAGVLVPEKNPPSIREGSAIKGPIGRGHHRTAYFVGGGLRGGK